MSLVARVIRQFRDGTEAVPLERTLPLAVPTMGARLDLREQGVEATLEVVAVTVRPGKILLQSRQTVCSNRCRAKRTRLRQAARDREVRELLERALKTMQ